MKACSQILHNSPGRGEDYITITDSIVCPLYSCAFISMLEWYELKKTNESYVFKFPFFLSFIWKLISFSKFFVTYIKDRFSVVIFLTQNYLFKEMNIV